MKRIPQRKCGPEVSVLWEGDHRSEGRVKHYYLRRRKDLQNTAYLAMSSIRMQTIGRPSAMFIKESHAMYKLSLVSYDDHHR